MIETIRTYERHAPDGVERIEFPGMEALYRDSSGR